MITSSRLAEEVATELPAAEHAPLPVVVASGSGWDLRRLRRCFSQENGFLLVEGYPDGLVSQCQRLAPCILIAGEETLQQMKPAEFAALTDFGRGVKVLACGSALDERTVQHLVRMGCMGFIEEGAPGPVLKKAVRAVAEGQIWADRKLLTRVLQQLLFAMRSPRLTPREKQILECIAKGSNNRTIAEKLCISHETVRWHIRSLHAKLGLQDRPGTTLFAKQYLEGDA